MRLFNLFALLELLILEISSLKSPPITISWELWNWTNSIDHPVNIISDGNSRIQCIEIKTANPLLYVSTYLPTKVENDRFEEYSECIDQLYEIIQKFQSSHEIVIGGDFNEDISKINNSRSANKLKSLISDCELQMNFHGPTFINVKGIDVSEIDYFLYKTSAQVSIGKLSRYISVSDHHPIRLKIIYDLTKKSAELNQHIQSRTRWDKMDLEKYESEFFFFLPKLKDLLISKTQSLNQTVRDTMVILNSTAEECSNQRKYGKNKLKLNIWNNNSKDAIKNNKIAHKFGSVHANL
jgi:hypothetical protein